MVSGGVRCWGASASGQLGEVTPNRSTPAGYDTFTQIAFIESGRSHSCSVSTGGAVRCWGSNGSHELGDLTDVLYRATPIRDVLTEAQAVNVGNGFTCALTTAGGVRCWGVNEYGQSGVGRVGRWGLVPDTDAITGVRAIAAGFKHACALTTAGGVRCWGSNGSGQLGAGSGVTSLLAPPVTDVLTGAQAIAVNEVTTCALMTTGGIRCWGDSAAGLFGEGPGIQYLPPVGDLPGLGGACP